MARQFADQALAPSTKRTYNTAQTRYITHCNSHNIAPLPVSQETLCSFVASLAVQGIAHKSIKSYLSGIHHFHITAYGQDPGIGDMALLKYVLQGIKRSQLASAASRPRTRLPITVDIMRLLKRAWEAQGISHKHAMLWAACCTCFFGFPRSGEATVPTQSSYDPDVHLSISDISLDSAVNPRALIVRVKASKTDPFRTGVDVYLGRTDRDPCPVSALLAYIALRGLNPGPLFRFEDGSPLTRDALVRELRAALAQSGLDPTPFSGHSFRIGAATTAAGIDDSLIKVLGRWHSSAYQLYIKLPRESLTPVSRRLAAQ